jgi:uncharacterized protein (TIGR02147 family)
MGMNIITYTNYRHLIKDFYDSNKQRNPAFSYQAFARKAGFKTKSYLIDVIAGRKPLSKESILRVARAMGLKKKETEFFEALVHFNDATVLNDREFYFGRLKAVAGKSSAETLQTDQYAYFSQWYHPVIRELVTQNGFNGNIEGLAKRVLPAISARQAKDAVEVLLRLNLLQKTAGGRFKLKDAALTTGDEVTSLAILKYQQKAIELASEALDRIPAAKRDISTVTAGVSEEGFSILKKEIQLFRKRLVQIIDEDKNQDRVYQINFQLFPLTKQ